ncbi:hypothetical protein AGMMS50268_25030 [Spirochaetia bacterium]|nr:hypothetical protein AGMMS50268_25030 [Spirochaetia bacterium]
MALDADALSTKHAVDILALAGMPPDGPAFAGLKRFWAIIDGDNYDHIKKNAEVPSGIALTTPDTVNGSTTEKGKVT